MKRYEYAEVVIEPVGDANLFNYTTLLSQYPAMPYTHLLATASADGWQVCTSWEYSGGTRVIAMQRETSFDTLAGSENPVLKTHFQPA